MSVVKESHLITPDGVTLFIRDWLIDASTAVTDDAPIQRSIVIMHGLGEHCGRYHHIATFLNSCGLSVRTYDHRGHGQSGGPRGDIPDSLALVRDAEFIIRHFAQSGHARPLLFGHSMGGLFAAQLAAILSTRLMAASVANSSTDIKEHALPVLQLAGIILSSPSFDLHLSWPEKLVLTIMSAIAPHVGVPTRFNARFLARPTISSEKKYPITPVKIDGQTAGQADTLLHDKISANLVKSMLSAIEYTQNHAPILTLPMLLLVSENDRLVDAKGSHMFIEHCPPQLCTAHFYHDSYHEVFNEAESSQVFSDLKNWLAARHFITDSHPGNNSSNTITLFRDTH